MSTEPAPDSERPYDAEEDVQQRLRLATPEHTTRGFLFTSIARFLRDFGESEAVVQRCLAASGEKTFAEFFNYPTRSLLLVLSAAARALSGRFGGYGEALRQLGFKAGESYMDTPVGRTAMQQAAGAAPQQVMTALQTLYWVLTSYGKPALTWTGPKSGAISVQRTFMPLAYHEGAVRAMAMRLGMRSVMVRARKTGESSIEVHVSW